MRNPGIEKKELYKTDFRDAEGGGKINEWN